MASVNKKQGIESFIGFLKGIPIILYVLLDPVRHPVFAPSMPIFPVIQARVAIALAFCSPFECLSLPNLVL